MMFKSSKHQKYLCQLIQLLKKLKGLKCQVTTHAAINHFECFYNFTSCKKFFISYEKYKRLNHYFRTQSNFNTHTRMCFSLLLMLTCLVRHAQQYYIELFPKINATASILELHILYRNFRQLESIFTFNVSLCFCRHC